MSHFSQQRQDDATTDPGRAEQQNNVYSIEDARSKRLTPPFDEPIYTVNEAAKILRLSANQARAIFRKEPGVHDFADDLGKSRFRLKRRSQLRIPHAVLTRFWKRTELYQDEPQRQVGSRRRL